MPEQISLIVCTRNRARQLRAMLETLRAQTYTGAWEIIVVDNGSTDNTEAVVAEFVQSSPCPTRFVTERAAGLSRARNRGLAVARGEIIAWTDDDCYPAPDYIAAVARCFEDPAIDFIGGRVLLFDPTDKRLTIQERDSRLEIEPFGYIDAGVIHGANMAFRRTALIQANGFDERLGAGTVFKCGEDADMLRRLSWAGHRGAYDPKPCVYHHHGRNRDEDVRRAHNGHHRGIGACFAKFGMRKGPRAVYLRKWYWLMRDNPLSTNLRQVGWGLLFLVRCGATPARVWSHPGLAPSSRMRK